MKKVIIPMLLLGNVYSNISSRVDEIDTRLTDIELSQVIKKFSLGGQFINHWETYAEERNYNSDERVGESVYTMSSILEIDINFMLTKKLSFFSRLGMAKFWNHENDPDGEKHSETDDTWDTSNQGSFGYWGSSPKFDRAYLSYNFAENTSNFSIGRMSTHKGPPDHYQFGDVRQGTYPRLAYNAIFDGMAYSYNFKKHLPKEHFLEFRAFYTPFVNISSSSRTDRRVISDSASQKQTAKPLTDQYNIQVEYQTKFENKFDFNFIYFYYNYTDFFQYVPDDDLYMYESYAHVLYTGFDKILNTGLNFNVSYQYNFTDEHITGADTKSHYKSHAWLLGLNYQFKNDFILGSEYIHTSPDYYIDEWTFYTISDFYKVANNNGAHYYMSFPIFDLTKLKIGLYDYKTKGSVTTDADTSKKKVRSVYATLKTVF